MKTNKKRKTINLDTVPLFTRDHLIDLYEGSFCKLTQLNEVDNEPVDYDSEKGYQTIRHIFEVGNTGIFYEGNCENWGQGDMYYTTLLTEVFQKEVSKFIYE